MISRNNSNAGPLDIWYNIEFAVHEDYTAHTDRQQAKC